MDAGTRALGLIATAEKILRTARDESIEHANTTLRRISHIAERQRYYRGCWLVSMPLPILRRLLEHCDLQDRIAVAQTCVALRLASRALPQLWSKIKLIDDCALYKAPDFVQWSYPRLVDVDIALRLHMDDPAPLPSFDAFTISIFPRLESFSFAVSVYRGAGLHGEHLVQGAWDRINRAISSPAPHLHSLSLNFDGSHHGGNIYYLRTDFLGGMPGALRTCALWGVRPSPIPGSCNALSMLETFDLIETSRMLTFHDVASVLAHSPAMVTLGLRARGFVADVDADVLSTAGFPRLKRLAVRDSTGKMEIEDVGRMCMRWFPSVKQLMVSLSSGSLPLHDQSEWPGPLRVYAPGYRAAAIDFGTADADEFSVKLWRKFDQDCLPILSSERLVRLFVHEHEVCRHGPLPSAPNLVDLCIVLASCAETRRTHMRLAGLFAETQLEFDYPALRTLRFAHLDVPPLDPCDSHSSYCTCKSGSTVALSDISDFIRSRLPLQPPGRRLDKLIFSCIRDVVDVDLARALRTLHTLVERVVFEPSLPQHLLRPVYPFFSGTDGWQLTKIFDSGTVSLSDINYEDWEIYERPRR